MVTQQDPWALQALIDKERAERAQALEAQRGASAMIAGQQPVNREVTGVRSYTVDGRPVRQVTYADAQPQLFDESTGDLIPMAQQQAAGQATGRRKLADRENVRRVLDSWQTGQISEPQAIKELGGLKLNIRSIQDARIFLRAPEAALYEPGSKALLKSNLLGNLMNQRIDLEDAISTLANAYLDDGTPEGADEEDVFGYAREWISGNLPPRPPGPGTDVGGYEEYGKPPSGVPGDAAAYDPPLTLDQLQGNYPPPIGYEPWNPFITDPRFVPQPGTTGLPTSWDDTRQYPSPFYGRNVPYRGTQEEVNLQRNIDAMERSPGGGIGLRPVPDRLRDIEFMQGQVGGIGAPPSRDANVPAWLRTTTNPMTLQAYNFPGEDEQYPSGTRVGMGAPPLSAADIQEMEQFRMAREAQAAQTGFGGDYGAAIGFPGAYGTTPTTRLGSPFSADQVEEASPPIPIPTQTTSGTSPVPTREWYDAFYIPDEITPPTTGTTPTGVEAWERGGPERHPGAGYLDPGNLYKLNPEYGMPYDPMSTMLDEQLGPERVFRQHLQSFPEYRTQSGIGRAAIHSQLNPLYAAYKSSPVPEGMTFGQYLKSQGNVPLDPLSAFDRFGKIAESVKRPEEYYGLGTPGARLRSQYLSAEEPTFAYDTFLRALTPTVAPAFRSSFRNYVTDVYDRMMAETPERPFISVIPQFRQMFEQPAAATTAQQPWQPFQ